MPGSGSWRQITRRLSLSLSLLQVCSMGLYWPGEYMFGIWNTVKPMYGTINVCHTPPLSFSLALRRLPLYAVYSTRQPRLWVIRRRDTS